MRVSLQLLAAWALAVAMTGCASIKSEAEAACEQRGGGEGCETGGKTKGKPEKFASPVDMVLSSASVPDAAHFPVDAGASASNVAATGYVILSLINSPSGSVQASRVFPWT